MDLQPLKRRPLRSSMRRPFISRIRNKRDYERAMTLDG